MQKISTLDDKIIQIPECSICLQSLSKDLCILVDCGHVFHKECIVILKKSAFQECPICRVQMNNVCDMFYNIKIKEIEDEPKYMANIIQIITLKEEIEKLKQDGNIDRDQVMNFEQIINTKDQKIQKLKQKNKNVKMQCQVLNEKICNMNLSNQILSEIFNELRKMLNDLNQSQNRSIQDKEQYASNQKSQQKKLNQQNNDNNQQQQQPLQIQFGKFEDLLQKFQKLIQDNQNQWKEKEEQFQIIQQSKSQKKQCLKQSQTFEQTQRQHK